MTVGEVITRLLMATIGLVMLGSGCALWYPPAGLIVPGVVLLAVGLWRTVPKVDE